MKKYMVAIYSSFALGISLYGIAKPSYELKQLVNLATPYMVVRVTVAIALAAYILLPKLRTYEAKTMLRASGATLLAFGVIGLLSPTFLGHLASYLPLGDVFILLEGGVLALLLSIELPAHKSQFSGKTLMNSLPSASQATKLLPAHASRAKSTANA